MITQKDFFFLTTGAEFRCCRIIIKKHKVYREQRQAFHHRRNSTKTNDIYRQADRQTLLLKKKPHHFPVINKHTANQKNYQPCFRTCSVFWKDRTIIKVLQLFLQKKIKFTCQYNHNNNNVILFIELGAMVSMVLSIRFYLKSWESIWEKNKKLKHCNIVHAKYWRFCEHF